MKCKICGGMLQEKEKGLFVCIACGQRYLGGELEAAMLESMRPDAGELKDAAGRALEKGFYDEAYAAYVTYLETEKEDPEGWWGKVLCRYGIQYEGSQLTVNRMLNQSVMNDPDLAQALKFANPAQAASYHRAVQEIAAIQKSFLERAVKEKPYDVFICYKATEDGTDLPTEDSRIAFEIYEKLNALGNLQVFFSRVALHEEHAGEAFEPYIYSALHTAKVMILVGTSQSHVNARWVRNEWRRYLGVMSEDTSRKIIPVLTGMTAAQLPEEIPTGYTLNWKGDETLTDIVEGVLNITGKGQVVPEYDEARTISLLRENMRIACEQEDYAKVMKYADEILDIDASFGEAYYYQLLAQYRVNRATKLADLNEDWTESSKYKYAMNFADPPLKNRLEAIRSRYEDRVNSERENAELLAEYERKKRKLEEAIREVHAAMDKEDYEEAICLLNTKAYEHPDAKKLTPICEFSLAAKRQIGDKRTYYLRTMEKENNPLFMNFCKSVRAAATGDKPDNPLSDSIFKLLISIAVIGLFAILDSMGLLANDGEHMVVKFIGCCILFGLGSGTGGLLVLIWIPIGCFFNWTMDWQDIEFTLLLAFAVPFIVGIIRIVALIKGIIWLPKWNAFVKAREAAKAFEAAKKQELHQIYDGKVVRGFFSKHEPVSIPDDEENIYSMIQTLGH